MSRETNRGTGRRERTTCSFPRHTGRGKHNVGPKERYGRLEGRGIENSAGWNVAHGQEPLPFADWAGDRWQDGSLRRFGPHTAGPGEDRDGNAGPWAGPRTHHSHRSSPHIENAGQIRSPKDAPARQEWRPPGDETPRTTRSQTRPALYHSRHAMRVPIGHTPTATRQNYGQEDGSVLFVTQLSAPLDRLDGGATDEKRVPDGPPRRALRGNRASVH